MPLRLFHRELLHLPKTMPFDAIALMLCLSLSVSKRLVRHHASPSKRVCGRMSDLLTT